MKYLISYGILLLMRTEVLHGTTNIATDASGEHQMLPAQKLCIITENLQPRIILDSTDG